MLNVVVVEQGAHRVFFNLSPEFVLATGGSG